MFVCFFLFTHTATLEIYTLSLHDALPIFLAGLYTGAIFPFAGVIARKQLHASDDTGERDRKSTRLNSSHLGISYAVFCLKKKKKTEYPLLRLQRQAARQAHCDAPARGRPT